MCASGDVVINLEQRYWRNQAIIGNAWWRESAKQAANNVSGVVRNAAASGS